MLTHNLTVSNKFWVEYFVFIFFLQTGLTLIQHIYIIFINLNIYKSVYNSQ